LIFTKCDVANISMLTPALEKAFKIMFTMKGNTCLPFVHLVSSKTNLGMDDLKLFMSEIISQDWGQAPIGGGGGSGGPL
jgi:hypothetical protein